MSFSRLSRLYQPRNPLFWLMVALNALSPMLAWIVHNRPLNAPAALLLTFFAVGNAVLGTWFAWRLMFGEPAPSDQPGQDGQDRAQDAKGAPAPDEHQAS